MGIYTMTEEEYNLLDLSGMPYNLSDIPNDSKELYLIMYSLYMNFLTQYIMNNTDLLKIDKQLQEKNDIVNFLPDEEKDTYQLLTNNMLKYFYVRNNLYLHRLTSEEMKILANKIQNNDYQYDHNIEKFIAETYKKVTLEKLDTNGQLVNYGPFHKKFFAPNNSIVIGVRFEDSYDYDKMIEQSKIYMDTKQNIEQSISNKLKYQVIVLRYDKVSVKKKITNNVKSK